MIQSLPLKTPNQLTANTKLLQKVAVWHQGEVLILKRAASSASRPGKWDLPGGNSEWPTTKTSVRSLHQQDIAREVMEETSIKIAPEKFNIETLVFFDTHFDTGKQVFTITCGWKLELPTDFQKKSVTISHEHTQTQWIKIAELDNYDFGGEKGQFIKDIILQSEKN